MNFKYALAALMIASSIQAPVNAKVIATSLYPKIKVQEERSIFDRFMGFMKSGSVPASDRVEVAELGFGYNSDQDRFLLSCMNINESDFVESERTEEEVRNGNGEDRRISDDNGTIGHTTGNIKIEIETGQSVLANTLGIDGSGRMDLSTVQGEGSLEILKMSETDDKTLNFVLSGSFVTGNKVLKNGVKFKSEIYRQIGIEGGDLTEQAKKFAKQCGNEVVTQVQLGGKLVIALNMKFSSSKIKKDFKAALQADIDASGISVSFDGKFKELSKKYNQHTKMTLRAYQIGGEPHKLFEILNNPTEVQTFRKEGEDKPSSASALINCSAGDFSSCYASMGRFMDYAGTSFVTQITNKPAILNYVTESAFFNKFYKDGVNPFTESIENITLQQFFSESLRNSKKIVGDLAKLDALITPPVGLRVTDQQKVNYEKTQKYLKDKLMHIANQAKKCMKDNTGCTSYMKNMNDSEVGNTIPTKFFHLKPISFAQYCDVAGQKLPIFNTGDIEIDAIDDTFEFLDRWVKYNAYLGVEEYVKLLDRLYKKTDNDTINESSKFDSQYCESLERFFKSKKRLNFDFKQIEDEKINEFQKSDGFYLIRTMAPFYYLKNVTDFNISSHNIEDLGLGFDHYKNVETQVKDDAGKAYFKIKFAEKNAYRYFERLLSLDLSLNENLVTLENIGYMQNLADLNISRTGIDADGFKYVVSQKLPQALEANEEGNVSLSPTKVLAYGIELKPKDVPTSLERVVHFSQSEKEYVFRSKGNIFSTVDDVDQSLSFKMPVITFGENLDQYLILGKSVGLSLDDSHYFEETYFSDETPLERKFLNHFGLTSISLTNGDKFVFGGVKKTVNTSSDGYRKSDWSWFTKEAALKTEVAGKTLTSVKIGYNDDLGSVEVASLKSYKKSSRFNVVDAKTIDLSGNKGHENTFAIFGGHFPVTWEKVKDAQAAKLQSQILRNIDASDFKDISKVYDVNKVKTPVIKSNDDLHVVDISKDGKRTLIKSFGIFVPFDAAVLVQEYKSEVDEDVYEKSYKVIVSGGIHHEKALTTNAVYHVKLVSNKYKVKRAGTLKGLSDGGRAGHKIVNIGGAANEERYLAIGGYQSNGIALDNVDMFSKESSGPIPGLKMNQARANFEIFEYNKRFVITGGVKKNLLVSRSKSDWAAFYNEAVGSDYTFSDHNTDLYCNDVRFVPKKHGDDEKFTLEIEKSNVCLNNVEYLEIKENKMIFGKDDDSTTNGSVLANKIEMKDGTLLLLGGLGLDEDKKSVTDTIFVGN